MATPFPFGSGNVLTAAQLNAVTTLVTSTKTNSHTLTIADVGTRVIMNSASPTTAVYVVPVCALIATTDAARVVAFAAVNTSPEVKVGLTAIMLLL